LVLKTFKKLEHLKIVLLKVLQKHSKDVKLFSSKKTPIAYFDKT